MFKSQANKRAREDIKSRIQKRAAQPGDIKCPQCGKSRSPHEKCWWCENPPAQDEPSNKSPGRFFLPDQSIFKKSPEELADLQNKLKHKLKQERKQEKHKKLKELLKKPSPTSMDQREIEYLKDWLNDPF